jgi:hypothetical protein
MGEKGKKGCTGGSQMRGKLKTGAEIVRWKGRVVEWMNER